MMLIADSGSTKTDWRSADEKKNIGQFSSAGLNPYFLSEMQLEQIIRENVLSKTGTNSISRIFFYGAGCADEKNKIILGSVLKKIFPSAEIEVDTDLLGAARALCGHNEGIAAILGTGSN